MRLKYLVHLKFVADAVVTVDPANLEVAITDDVGAPCAYGAWHAGRAWIHIPNVVDFSFDSGSDVIEAHVHPGGGRAPAIDAYNSMGLPLVLQATQRHEVIHASAVATSSGVVGFCGISEQGKSTIAHGLALRGYELWADDALAFRAQLDGVLATALPFEPNLRPTTHDFFAKSEGASDDVRVAPAWSTLTFRGLFMLAPSVPRTKAIDTIELSQLSAGEALRALLPHGFRFKPTSTARDSATLAAYADLVMHIPVLRLGYVRNLEGLPSLLDRIESEIEGLNNAPATLGS